MLGEEANLKRLHTVNFIYIMFLKGQKHSHGVFVANDQG